MLEFKQKFEPWKSCSRSVSVVIWPGNQSWLCLCYPISYYVFCWNKVGKTSYNECQKASIIVIHAQWHKHLRSVCLLMLHVLNLLWLSYVMTFILLPCSSSVSNLLSKTTIQEPTFDRIIVVYRYFLFSFIWKII